MARPETPEGTKKTEGEPTYRASVIETNDQGHVTVDFNSEYRERHGIQQRRITVHYTHLCKHGIAPSYSPLKKAPDPGETVRVRKSDLQRKIQKLLGDTNQLPNKDRPNDLPEDEITSILKIE